MELARFAQALQLGVDFAGLASVQASAWQVLWAQALKLAWWLASDFAGHSSLPLGLTTRAAGQGLALLSSVGRLKSSPWRSLAWLAHKRWSSFVVEEHLPKAPGLAACWKLVLVHAVASQAVRVVKGAAETQSSIGPLRLACFVQTRP